MQALLAAEGIAVYAISYDAVDVLAGFAERYGIDYPLLSDADSAVIRSLGILNEEAPERIAGIPHPGVFVLAASGVIAEKHFYPSYRERDAASGLLERALGIASPISGLSTEVAGDVVRVHATLDAPAFAWGQRLWLGLHFDVQPGYHVYGQPIPDGYEPLTLRFTTHERVSVGEPIWPQPARHTVDGLDDEFWVYDGSFRVDVPVTFMVVDAGDVTVETDIALQACTDTDCLLPSRLPVSLTVPEMPLIERMIGGGR